ncbi:hypothetical protein [Streptomyces sp. WAC06614]|uniref:hypothetical protein n=1 Tax=Streptomyces sp. WAC06614 TaxID=2487416 RepID=UPI000F78FBCC|nr:hypothetical protein [Streptomyces sp. WAC06614]RSS80672.1 hypothetical protein EF918_12820 [Streptomyces sp. WAC06614]
MTSGRTVSDLMTTDVTTAHTEPAHTEPAHTEPAHTEPAHTEPDGPDRTGRPVVLLDGAGHPCALIGPDGPQPVLVVSARSDIGVLLSSADVLDALDGPAGIAGLVVVRAGTVVGVVPRDALREEAVRLLESAGPQLGIDSDPLGRPTDLPDPVRIRCTTCGEDNTFEYYVPWKAYTCQKGAHRLVPPSRRGGT